MSRAYTYQTRSFVGFTRHIARTNHTLAICYAKIQQTRLDYKQSRTHFFNSSLSGPLVDILNRSQHGLL